MAGHAHPHAPGQHDPHLAHHFATPTQQLEAGKLGMWVFLVTEVLLFSGLFCAYAVYRAAHPEIFQRGHQFLDIWLGGINTVILICSSLTMAWAVRAAQLGKRRLLIGCLALTLLGAIGFLGIKYVEYRHKWHDGLLWAGRYNPAPGVLEGGHGAAQDADHAAVTAPATQAPAHAAQTIEPEVRPFTAPPAGPTVRPEVAAGQAPPSAHSEATAATRDRLATPATPAPHPSAPQQQSPEQTPTGQLNVEHSRIPLPAVGPVGLATAARAGTYQLDAQQAPRELWIFFSIYFLLTGLHGLHVLGGMGAISWVLARSIKGQFGPAYYTPVDLVGLYWHLVDIIWIFLFPLLYLIH